MIDYLILRLGTYPQDRGTRPVVEVGLIDTISDETIRRTLKKTIPSPG
jgi:hypothetical protein